MTEDEIIALAKEAGLHEIPVQALLAHARGLLTFSALIEANTREACAKICTDWAAQHAKDTGECTYEDCDMIAVAVDLAEQIRSLK